MTVATLSKPRPGSRYKRVARSLSVPNSHKEELTLMNSTLATELRHEHPVQHDLPEQHYQPERRVGLADRAALHLGVALIKWGRRPVTTPQYERRANRLERALAGQQRDSRVEAAREAAQLNYAPMRRLV
jgi:hypothetical protein